MKNKEIQSIIETERKIWKTAYPDQEELLDTFTNKIIFELWRDGEKDE